MRPHRQEDFADCLALWSDETVTRFIGGRPQTREEVWARLLRYAGHWQYLDYGYWHVRTKAADAFVGEVGFADFHRDMTPSFEGIPEIGWCLMPGQQGKGYGAEAVAGALAWGRQRFGAGSKTGCIIGPENKRSLLLAEKLGFVGGWVGFYKDHDVALFYRDL